MTTGISIHLRHTHTNLRNICVLHATGYITLKCFFFLNVRFKLFHKRNQLLMTYSPTFLPEPIIASNFKLKLVIHAIQMSIV